MISAPWRQKKFNNLKSNLRNQEVNLKLNIGWANDGEASKSTQTTPPGG
jgi:hypothetical protein